MGQAHSLVDSLCWPVRVKMACTPPVSASCLKQSAQFMRSYTIFHQFFTCAVMSGIFAKFQPYIGKLTYKKVGRVPLSRH